MSTGGRPRLPYLRADLKISINAAVAAQVDLLLEDPITKKPKYGARSKLVEGLFNQWLATMKNEPAPQLPSLTELREGV